MLIGDIVVDIIKTEMQILPEISNTDDFLGCKLSAILAVISVKMLFVKSLLDW